jgi:allantoinase
MAEVIFRGRVLTSDGEARRQVTVADGVITEIRPFDRLRAQDGMRPELVEGRTSPVIELADDEILLPGLVDTHVHVNEPGRTEWEGSPPRPPPRPPAA